MTPRDSRRGGYVAPPTTPSAPRPPLRSQASWERDAQLALERARERRDQEQDRLLPTGSALAHALIVIGAVAAICVIALLFAVALATHAP